MDCDCDILEQFSLAELHAIEVHKYYLSEKAGYDVGQDFAIKDWLANYAARWRYERLKKDLEEQLKEIEVYKWIESEKAGHDVGQQAAIDWICRFADDWRRKRDPEEIAE
jgi:stress response protein YsnF